MAGKANGAAAEPVEDSPVVGVLQKRLRNLKKRVRNVEGIQQKVDAGKALNQDEVGLGAGPGARPGGRAGPMAPALAPVACRSRPPACRADRRPLATTIATRAAGAGADQQARPAGGH